jgi:hypothetical protein
MDWDLSVQRPGRPTPLFFVLEKACLLRRKGASGSCPASRQNVPANKMRPVVPLWIALLLALVHQLLCAERTRLDALRPGTGGMYLLAGGVSVLLAIVYPH